MSVPWESVSVSVVMPRCSPLVYDQEAWLRSVRSVLDQDGHVQELIIAYAGTEEDEWDQKVVANLRRETADRIGSIKVVSRVIDDARRPGVTARATALEAGIQEASSAFLLLVMADEYPVVLRRSCLSTMLMAAVRGRRVAMVYGDYALSNADGEVVQRRLLEHHSGRLWDSFDLGRVWLLDRETVGEVGGVRSTDGAADLYSLRLRIGERADIAHVGSAKSGALYTVEAAASKHDVFDYLRDDQASQQQYERAVSDHLERIGARLSPDRAFGELVYSSDEERGFETCIASVVIPVFQRPEFIGSSIESVLTQTIRNIEVIVVVNGGADDPTCAEVRRFMEGGDRYRSDRPEVRLVIVDVNNIGMCLNVGLAQARGKYYVQLDSDDRLKPDAVGQLLDVFASDPKIGMVIGSYEVWDLDSTTGQLARREDIPVVTHDEWTDENGPNNLLRVNGAGAPRSAHIKAIREVGWFGVNDSPHSRNYGEDYDLVLRISENYRIGRVWDPVYEVIRHAGGTDHTVDQSTIDRNVNAKDFMRLEAIRRRRKLNDTSASAIESSDK